MPARPAAAADEEHAADTVYDPALMAQKRRTALIGEHGGMAMAQIMIDRLELTAGAKGNGYAWEGDGWWGGDYDRIWLKTEGEGKSGKAPESADVQALWSHAVRPFFDLQLGIRHDIRPKQKRTHLAIGIQGLAPYWFEIDAAAFLSTKGDLTARFEAEYDQRITNALILQPRVELDLAAQDVADLGIGAGLSSAELGLRLRYRFVPEFAPYIGIGYERKFGDTARSARTRGDKAGGWNMLFGVRTWF